jgi:prolipoprotein diacylglyceryl transferase
MAHGIAALPQFIPSPPINSFHVGPLAIHFYALGYIIGIALAILITRRRWRALGGNPDLVNDIALWVVPAGIIGGRIYFDITTPDDIPHVWYGLFAVWTGGLGIWGGVALAAAVGAWRLHKLGITVGPFANAIAPALLVAQAIGRIGNYFNKELFGKPTTLPWGLEIPYSYRQAGGIPPQDLHYATFQPSFLYELIWDLALAAFLVWLGHHAKIKPWGLFALYVAGYSAYRIFEETIRIDSSEYFLGLRLNMFVAIALTVVGLVWFILAQRRPDRPYTVLPASAAGAVEDTKPDDAAAVMNAPEAVDPEEDRPETVSAEAVDPGEDRPETVSAEAVDAGEDRPETVSAAVSPQTSSAGTSSAGTVTKETVGSDTVGSDIASPGTARPDTAAPENAHAAAGPSATEAARPDDATVATGRSDE